MWFPSKQVEEVGIQLLLLSIYLFDNFSIFNDYILLKTKNGFQRKYIRVLLRLLHITTGHSFYAKKDVEEGKIRIFCLDQPDFFQLLQSRPVNNHV